MLSAAVFFVEMYVGCVPCGRPPIDGKDDQVTAKQEGTSRATARDRPYNNG